MNNSSAHYCRYCPTSSWAKFPLLSDFISLECGRRKWWGSRRDLGKVCWSWYARICSILPTGEAQNRPSGLPAFSAFSPHVASAWVTWPWLEVKRKGPRGLGGESSANQLVTELLEAGDHHVSWKSVSSEIADLEMKKWWKIKMWPPLWKGNHCSVRSKHRQEEKEAWNRVLWEGRCGLPGWSVQAVHSLSEAQQACSSV